MRFFRLFHQMMYRNTFRRNLFVMGIGLLMAFVNSVYSIETKIAFSSTRDSNTEIYVMKSDGTKPVRLTTNNQTAPAYDETPSWSPDGERIVFQA